MRERENAGWIDVGSLEELAAAGVRVVRAMDRPVAVFVADGQAKAVDNRCPHMGFPLHKGTVRDGILTCHWHHARFDLCSGCTFDLFADDVAAFDVRVHDGRVLVADRPRVAEDRAYHAERLRRGLEHNIALLCSKSILGMLGGEDDLQVIYRELADFALANSQNWQNGLTTLAAVANLMPHLSHTTRIHALTLTAARIAGAVEGMPPRRPRQPLESDEHSLATLARWYRHWVRVRHSDAAERTIATVARHGAECAVINDVLIGAANQRTYSAAGHTLDEANKAMELLEVIGLDRAADVLQTVSASVVPARGEEEGSGWRQPIDLIELLRSGEAELVDAMDRRNGRSAAPADGIENVLLGDDPQAIVALLIGQIRSGVPLTELARHVAYAAALRLVRFPLSNDVNDWFGPVHTFIYCNAAWCALNRSESADVAKALLHGAMAIYQDRFLNMPQAKVPEPKPDETSDPQALRSAMLKALDTRSNVDELAGLVLRYLRAGHSASDLIDTLAFAVVREDLDFHPLQVLEAAARQASLWDDPRRVEMLYVAAARYVASLCPTRRSSAQTPKIAMRLHRNEAMYDEQGQPIEG